MFLTCRRVARSIITLAAAVGVCTVRLPAASVAAWDWQPAAACAGPGTWFSAAFTIAGHAYVGTGYDFGHAFWRYDDNSGRWSAVRDFPGAPRGAAFAFALAGKGYVGGGFADNWRFADLWEYDAAADRWAEKSAIPGRPRDHASAFVIGERAFVAGGMTCAGNDCSDLKELWEYDARADRWTRRADLPEAASAAASFVVREKAYLVSGRAGAGFSQGVLAYDAQRDEWTRKGSFAGPVRTRGIGFAIGGRGYVATGLRAISATSAQVLRDIWEYDPARDAWSQQPDLGIPARGGAVAFVFGSRVFIGTGVDGRHTLLDDFWWADAGPSQAAPTRAAKGTLPPSAGSRVDALVKASLAGCESLNIAVVDNGRIVYAKAYGEGRLGDEHEYGSVSKPVTSTIIMQLRREGLIASLDDDVRKYLPKYGTAMPAAYKDSPLTLKHLVTHRGGIPHNDQPMLVEGKFNLKFQPGTNMLYSTPGYGLLGEVIRAVTGLSYSDAVRKYIGDPVGASSIRAEASYIAPGAFVVSSIEDMARFAAGIVTNRYIPADMLLDEVLHPETGNYGYGWRVDNRDPADLTASHSGSNGLPRAHILIKPRQKQAVVILAQLRVFKPLDLETLASQVLEAAREVRQ